MRFLPLCLIALYLSSCVSPKKLRETSADYEARLDALATVLALRQDSIYSLTLALERSRGGNDMLLETQDRLQDRLARQDDELEQLRGSFNSTSSQLNERLTELQEEKEGMEKRMDTLVGTQRRTIRTYQAGLQKAANVISDSLEIKLPTDKYLVAERPGEVVVSIQEEMLFRRKSTGTLVDEHRKVLRIITDALQENPLLKLQIIGHTDNQPTGIRGTDNWEFAALRAARLADEFEKTFYVSPNRIIAASQGEYSPTRSNATEEGRAMNRRVDFVLTSSVSNLLRALDKVAEMGK